MKVLITGATGFIGSHLVKRMLKYPRCEEIYCTSRRINVTMEGAKVKNVYHYRIDLTDIRKVKHLFECIQPDIIFHLAGNASPKPSDNQSDVIYNNIISTQNMCQYAPEGCKIIFSSSVIVYGDYKSKCTESYVCKPTSLYGVTKLASEGIINAYTAQGHIRNVCLRLCATVGLGLTHGMVYDFIRKLKSDTPYLEAFGDYPGTEKPFCHIRDVIDILCKVAETDKYDSQIYNIVPLDTVNVDQAASAVMNGLDIFKPIKWLGSKSTWKGDNKRLLIDCSKIRKDMGNLKDDQSWHAISNAVADYV